MGTEVGTLRVTASGKRLTERLRDAERPDVVPTQSVGTRGFILIDLRKSATSASSAFHFPLPFVLLELRGSW